MGFSFVLKPTRTYIAERFWAPPKRAPRPLDAEQLSDFAIRFIDSCSELISRIYVVREDHSVNVAEYAKTCPVLDYDDGQELVTESCFGLFGEFLCPI